MNPQAACVEISQIHATECHRVPSRAIKTAIRNLQDSTLITCEQPRAGKGSKALETLIPTMSQERRSLQTLNPKPKALVYKPTKPSKRPLKTLSNNTQNPCIKRCRALIRNLNLPLVSREWKIGSNSSYNCTPFLHSLPTKGKF